MKIIVDENIPLITVKTLKDMGHDVKDIRGTNLKDITDDELWKIAKNERRLLITTDKGFVRFRTEQHSGLLIALLSKPSRQKIHDRLLLALKQQQEKTWLGLCIVIRDNVKSIFKIKTKHKS